MRRGLFVSLALLLASCGGSTRVELVADGLETPFGVAFDDDDSMYVVEYKGNRILRAVKGGALEPFAGTGRPEFRGDGGPAAQAGFHEPHSLVALAGKLYVADTRNHRIRVIDLASGLVDTLAGTGERARSPEGAAGKAAHLDGPFAVDGRDGRLYVADLFNRRIAQIDLVGAKVRTLAGSGVKGAPDDDAAAAQAPLVDPRAAAIDKRGHVYVLERQGNALRAVDPQGRIRTLIGPDHPEIRLSGPKHLAIDLDGDVIIADDQNHRILEYNPDGGKWAVIAGTGGAGDLLTPGDPLATQLRRPHGVAVHPSGDIYIADSSNGRVLRLRR